MALLIGITSGVSIFLCVFLAAARLAVTTVLFKTLCSTGNPGSFCSFACDLLTLVTMVKYFSEATLVMCIAYFTLFYSMLYWTYFIAYFNF